MTGQQPIEPAPLGALLAEARKERGLSACGLAALIGAAPSTVTRIERAERRVSPAMVASLAEALSPDDAGPLRAALTSAAGPLLSEDTPGGVRRRERRMRKSRRERNRRVIADFRRREAMQRRAAELTSSAWRLMEQPEGSLDQVDALLDESDRLRAAAGPPIGTIFEQQLIATAKTFGRAASRAAGNAPKRRRPGRTPLRAPARDGSASEREILAYVRERTRQELGVEYDD